MKVQQQSARSVEQSRVSSNTTLRVGSRKPQRLRSAATSFLVLTSAGCLGRDSGRRLNLTRDRVKAIATVSSLQQMRLPVDWSNEERVLVAYGLGHSTLIAGIGAGH
jgi:hypothetical protein